MKNRLVVLLTFLIAAILGHIVVLQKAPGFIMGKAISMMEKNGVGVHAFTLSPRMTPQSQTVVRPSPDLAYSICRFDLSDAPLKITAAAYEPYASVSLFDAQTNNFATVRAETGANFRLLPPGSTANNSGDIVSPTRNGLILIRRLAPTAEAHADVKAISSGDNCAPEN